jgi:asparagine synthase (glutamine-hydrolysing)
MHTAKRVSAPRRYVMQDEDQVVLFSGLPVNSTGTFVAHHAEDLSAHWDQLTENLEGQFSIARVNDQLFCLELQTDILGYEQVYYFQQGSFWLISNSVLLIEQLCGFRDFDPLGVSLFLGTGWVGADRTLRSDIRVIPHGQKWIWNKDDVEPKKLSYYPASRLAHLPRFALNRSNIQNLADRMIQLCRNLCQSFDNIKCSLTGGRDSRLIAAMLISAGLPARYYTFGDPAGDDVRIAKQIARSFNLPYEVETIISSDVIREWDKASWQSIRQGDGMRSLFLIAGILKNLRARTDCLDMLLWGAAGEVARGCYFRPKDFFSRIDEVGVERLLNAKRNMDFRGLIRKDGTELVREYIHNYVIQCLDDGFAPIDIPDVFEIYQGDGRRVGCNARGLMEARDVFSPYCSRFFLEAAFSIPAIQRYTEPLHYNLLKILQQKLHELPFDKESWRFQQPYLNLFYKYFAPKLDKSFGRISCLLSKRRRKSTENPATFNRFDWFEVKRKTIREICLDQNDSSLWNYVDRQKFEQIMDDDADPADRSGFLILKVLYNISSLFYYDADEWRKSAVKKGEFLN